MNLGDLSNSEYGLIDCHAQILGLKNSEDEDNLSEIEPGKDIEEKSQISHFPNIECFATNYRSQARFYCNRKTVAMIIKF